MSGRETRDFMSVDSFSQLPFIRPSPKPSNSSTSANSAIRLFGIEFQPDSPSKEPATATATVETNTANSSTTATAAASSGSETGRKFECHYCCRNFPTSQALGGHQNAHKRERQHAKRAHLQSAMAAAAHAHAHAHHHAPTAEGHVYGIINYHRMGSSPTGQHHAAARFGLETPTGAPPLHYPSWSSSSGGGGARFYEGLGSVAQPINGSPLPGLWRVPNATTTMGMVVHRDNHRSAPLPLFGGDLESKPVAVVPTAFGTGSSSSSSSSSFAALAQDPRGSDSGPRDHSVSLDLHL